MGLKGKVRPQVATYDWVQSVLWKMHPNSAIPPGDTFVVGVVHQPQGTTFHGQAKLAFKNEPPGLSSRWRGGNILSSPPLTDTYTATTHRAAVSVDDLKTSRTDVLQLQISRKSHTESLVNTPHPAFPMWWLTSGRDITTAEVVLEEWGVQALAGGPAPRRGAPITSGFEYQRGLCLGEPKNWRKPKLCSFGVLAQRQQFEKHLSYTWRWHID